MIRAVDIHARLGDGWPAVLAQLGIAEEFLRPKKAGPCPACGGRDRFTFDNRKGRGDFICRGCGAGDGFALLQRVHGWDFREARQRVLQVAGLACGEAQSPASFSQSRREEPPPLAKPTARVLEILRGACEPADVADAREYLASRKLWPLPERCTLAAHATLEYFEERKRIGRFAALLAHVRDCAGELVTAHVTYLAGGRKLTDHEPRKLISPVSGRAGVAVRLLPIAGDALGIAEGLETAIAAHRLHELPVWAALNTALLGRFEPPRQVHTLVVFADRDAPGLEAAGRLMERLQGRVRVELRVPPAPAKDWADVLVERVA
jgi:putative DNA primase/helicase